MIMGSQDATNNRKCELTAKSPDCNHITTLLKNPGELWPTNLGRYCRCTDFPNCKF